jgi:two-component sensor histidine kinase
MGRTNLRAKHLKLSLRLRLFILAAVALAPALAILAYNEVSLRRSRVAEVHQLAIRFGQLATQELEGIVGGTEGLVRAVARAPVVRSFDPKGCRAFLADVQAQTPSLSTLTAIDLDGRVRCRPEMPTNGQTLADRPYFRAAVASGGFVVGEYTVSRISGRSGLPLAVPIRDETEQMIGVLAAGLDLDWLGQRLKGRNFTQGGGLTIADRNGVIIAREPLPEQFIGTRIPEPFLPLVQATAPGSREVLSQDGTRRIIGYVPPATNSAGMYVSAGLAAEEVFAAVDRATQRGALLAAFGALVAFLSAWLIGRSVVTKPVERLIETIRAWRSGNQDARTGMLDDRGEFETVGSALDGLMDELALRQEHQRLLIDELNHRVKNTLATVQSIAMQTFRGDAASAQARATFESRLMALSKAQDVLTRVNWEGADLEEIVREAVEPHCGDDRARFEVKGPRVTLPPRMALSLAMALHELCTNAAKYGGFSTVGGRATVEWLLVVGERGRRLRLTWRESGGPAVAPPQRRGFGSRLIEQGLARELNGEVRLEYAPSGVICTIDVPIVEVEIEQTSPQPGDDSQTVRAAG